jgi:hypothetical protein
VARVRAVEALGVSLAVALVATGCGGSKGADPGAESRHAIRGAVAGAVESGVTLTLAGPASATTVTVAGGQYAFPALLNGSYTVTPSRAGYTFSPASRAVTVSGADQTGHDFTASALTYTISGTVSGAASAGVTVVLSGPVTRRTTTAGGGTFSFTGVAPGSYTLRTTLSGFSFTPPTRSVTVSAADRPDQDFVAAAIANPHAISGAVSGAVTAGVTLTLSGDADATTTSDAGGAYSFAGLADGSYEVTPSLAGYAFTPLGRSVTVSGADRSGQGFTAAPLAEIAGVITGDASSCVEVVLTGGAAPLIVRTEASGSYRFTGVADGTYTVTPRKQGHAFDPPSATVVVAGADVLGCSFAETAGASPTYTVCGFSMNGAATPPVEFTLTSLADGSTASTTTNARGDFYFDGLPQGGYRLVPSLAPGQGIIATRGSSFWDPVALEWNLGVGPWDYFDFFAVFPDESISRAHPIPLAFDVAVVATIAISAWSPFFGDVDYFSLVVPPGGANVRIRTFDVTGVTCNGIDTVVSGAVDDSGPGYCEDSVVPLAAGTQILSVGSGYGSASFPFGYTLLVTLQP